MARMAIRVSGHRQKHGALLADEIAKWLLRFSGDPLTTDSSLPVHHLAATPSPYSLPFCEIHSPFSCPNCINISHRDYRPR
jgi:hypothetical protein